MTPMCAMPMMGMGMGGCGAGAYDEANWQAPMRAAQELLTLMEQNAAYARAVYNGYQGGGG